ncbi:transcription factor HBP-1b(c38)-like [Rutidosis leptorrhynchoides]|uniref:transcription factor HBP-1b(c38)-like n=1 Tax=Rutidosis leptorrhynchoides TaxID=125765 RepID=UPI003A9A2BD0
MDSAKKILPHLQQQKLTKILRNREYVKRSTERKKQSIPANKTIVFPQCNESDTLKFSEVYKCWFNVHNDHISRLRNAMLTNQSETELHHIILTVFDHLKSQFLLREFTSKDDVLNLLYGTWMTPAELCVMWLGGFRPSDVVHLLNVHLQLTPEQNQFLINLKNDTFKQETELTKQFTQIQSTLSTRLVGEVFR